MAAWSPIKDPSSPPAWVYSHGGPIGHRKCGYILTADQSDAGSVGIFLRRTNQTQEVWVYSHGGPIRRRKCGYILTTDQSGLLTWTIRSSSSTNPYSPFVPRIVTW
eukprot:1190150-Prorocentrum_minimum.AAC.2